MLLKIRLAIQQVQAQDLGGPRDECVACTSLGPTPRDEVKSQFLVVVKAIECHSMSEILVENGLIGRSPLK